MGPVAVLSYRLIGTASIELNDDEVVVRNLRTRRIPWSRIREVGVTRGSSAAGMRFRVPYFKLHDGSLIVAQDVRTRREGTVVDEVIAEARRRLIAEAAKPARSSMS